MIELTEQQWRTIHNALAVHQCYTVEPERRKYIQEIMDKVRDEAIAVILVSKDRADGCKE